MALYKVRVVVTRTVDVYIEAHSQDEARAIVEGTEFENVLVNKAEHHETASTECLVESVIKE